MEWVETRGRTLAEAVERALERLGVVESDAEVVVLEEPRTSMFGLRKSEARVRARVRPVQARAKRPSRRSQGQADGRGRARANRPPRSDAEGGRRTRRDVDRDTTESTPSPRRRTDQSQRSSQQARSRTVSDNGTEALGEGQEIRPRTRSRSRNRNRNRQGTGVKSTPVPGPDVDSGDGSFEGREMSIESQAEMAKQFVAGVVERFGLAADTTSAVEDDTVRIDVVGDNLGLLIGPRGSTADALQELTRTVVQQRREEQSARIVVDVGGYRLRRAAALQQFAQRVAAEVLESGEPQALDPMNPADRKIVHDAVNEMSGVRTTSEGEEPRRYVVVHPTGVEADEPNEAD